MAIVTFQHIQCLHLMYAEVASVLVSSGNQVQPQIIVDPDYPQDYLSVSFDYDVEIEFRPGKAGQFSRFACIFFLCKHVILQNRRFIDFH